MNWASSGQQGTTLAAWVREQLRPCDAANDRLPQVEALGLDAACPPSKPGEAGVAPRCVDQPVRTGPTNGVMREHTGDTPRIPETAVAVGAQTQDPGDQP